MIFRTRGTRRPAGSCGRGSDRMAGLAGLAAAPVVVVSVFRAVLREWPITAVQLVSFTPWLVLPAGLLTGPSVRSADYAVRRVSGTDHAAITATLSVPAAGQAKHCG